MPACSPMETPRAIELMQAHQARLIAHVRGSIALLDQPPETVLHTLAKRRWRTLQLLREYQLFKHTEIFAPTIRSGTPGRRRAAQALFADCVAAGEAFRAYTLRWSGQDVLAVWDEYRAAGAAAAQMIVRQLDDERARITALLHGVRRTRYPD